MNRPPYLPEQPERSFFASLAAMVGISLAFMLIALNTSVVGTAMPSIVADLSGYALYQWSASAFLVGNAVMIPITGRLGDLYGRKPFVLASVLLFALASIACGASQTMLQLVLARACQGLAGGMLLGVASACVPDLFPDEVQRVRWQVLLSVGYGLALAVGPWMGGWLTENVGWRYVFYINLPVAIAALLMVWVYFPHILHHEGRVVGGRSIDWLGALLLLLAMGGLLGAAEHCQLYGFASVQALGVWAVTGALTYGFFRHQYHTAAPIVPPEILDNEGARRLMLLGMLTGLTMFMLIFYTPLLLQGSFGQSPHQAGVVMTPLLVFITIGSIVNSRLLPRLQRAERLVAWGQMGTMLSCLALTQVDATTPKALLMAVFALCGSSLGFQLPNLSLQIMAVAGRSHMGVASALAQSTRMIGSMVGVGVASVLVNTFYARQIAAAVTRYQIGDAQLVTLLSSPQLLIRQQDQDAMLALARDLGQDPEPLLEAARQGLVRGTHAAFLLCALIAAISVLVSWRLPHYSIRRQSPPEA